MTLQLWPGSVFPGHAHDDCVNLDPFFPCSTKKKEFYMPTGVPKQRRPIVIPNTVFFRASEANTPPPSWKDSAYGCVSQGVVIAVSQLVAGMILGGVNLGISALMGSKGERPTPPPVQSTPEEEEIRMQILADQCDALKTDGKIRKEVFEVLAKMRGDDAVNYPAFFLKVKKCVEVPRP
jgi:hypothetical protein